VAEEVGRHVARPRSTWPVGVDSVRAAANGLTSNVCSNSVCIFLLNKILRISVMEKFLAHISHVLLPYILGDLDGSLTALWAKWQADGFLQASRKNFEKN
jgi:hypothetical protein